MNKNIIVLCTALFCTLILPALQPVDAATKNILKDVSFELQKPAAESGWILFDESRYSKDMARSSAYSMFNWGFSRILPSPPYLHGSASGSYQEFPASPGSRWRLTGFGAARTVLKGAPAFGIVQVSFFDSRGNDLGAVETTGGKNPRAKTSNEVNSQSPVGEWIFLDTGIATAPAGTATVQAFTLYVDYSGAEIAQGVYFDDLSLCALENGDDESACK